MQLEQVVELVGWVSLEQLQAIYGDSHACIVPTRSAFNEGLAMTAVEAVLAGRPLVSNPVVPATELLAPACLLGKTNDYKSHAEAVLELSQGQQRYELLRDACDGLALDFLDARLSLRAAVKQLLADRMKV